jgi:glycosyltransferase involved in cell wall biosynthesis
MIAVMHGEKTNPALLAEVDSRVEVEQLRLPAKQLWFKADGLARRLGIDRSLIRTAQRRWLKQLIRRFAPDILHSHLLKADRLVADVRASFPVAGHVVTLHGDYAPFLQGQAEPQLLGLNPQMARIVAQSDVLVAICEPHRDFIRDHFPAEAGKTELIYNGFSPWRAAAPVPVNSTKLVFGMASRGVKLKGWSKAIAAFGRLKPGLAELVLVGEGPYLDSLALSPVPDGVRFAGFSNNPVDWISSFDVCLLPSEFPHESLPTAVMEYLFCGKPVIATDLGEIATMMRAPDGQLAGQLLDFDDGKVSVNQLTAAMQAYLDEPAQGRRAGPAITTRTKARIQRLRRRDPPLPRRPGRRR